MSKKDAEENILDQLVWKNMDSLNETRVKYGQKPYTKEEFLNANPMSGVMHGITKRLIKDQEDE